MTGLSPSMHRRPGETQPEWRGGVTFLRSFVLRAMWPSCGHAERLLTSEEGQTELSVAMAIIAGITPAVTVCEMLDDHSGLALSKNDAQAYARNHDSCSSKDRRC